MLTRAAVTLELIASGRRDALRARNDANTVHLGDVEVSEIEYCGMDQEDLMDHSQTTIH